MKSLFQNQFRRRLISLFAKSPKLPGVHQLVRLYCDAVDGELSGDIQINGEGRLIKDEVPKCRVVIDGGACVGAWSSHVLKANPKIQLHCIEPLRENVKILKEKLSRENVHVHQFALGDELGVALMNPKTQSQHRDSDGATEEVKLLSLDAFCADQGIEKIDFLKLDLEGSELSALQGARRLLSENRIARIQFEYGPEHVYARVQLRDLFEFLESFGFRFFKILPRGLEAVPNYTTWLENYRYKNFYAVRETS